ncbi:hypothetical protein NS228_05325 [Methylobacterium indicum]|uniref:hypothetical protein n=1 Tax=Methylobacterium indicum TaxID=1775910 RepID=UPI000733C9ED|nr:hypothetical protein [Methylobacterium indicum]KTS34214.1 hypothetical protein NS229_11400 [Methylobacterium indicum]KTS41802.1 hypothetical protein NS228_05325 [Methylobacterium indicum]KTS53102.1 hypothetical protein NS230_07650 [Methylobacterium indicum]
MADAGNIAATPFDGATVWSTLSPEQQERIGAVALELAVGRAIAEHAPDPACRAGMEAERIALHCLQDAVLGVGGLPDRQWIDPAGDRERYRIPSVVGSVCQACGCSQEDPCDEGCGWHDAVTCTACVVPEEAA